MYNHDHLKWQFQWAGARLINQRILVCQTCYDTPQEQLRTIILPPDPVAIEYPVPENYATTDNPISGIGFSNNPLNNGTNIGTLVSNAGLSAAFDGNTNKQSWRSASVIVSVSSYQNTIGKNWYAGLSGATVPSQLTPSQLLYEVTSFSVYAPSDKPLLSTGITGINLEGSLNGIGWTTLYSTTTLGTNAEVITSLSSNITSGNYQYHRVNIQGDGVGAISVAQVQFNVANTGQNEQ